MKRFCRILSLCLVAALILGTLCVGGSATSVRHYDAYAMLGDSIPAGYGLDTYPGENGNVLDGTRVAGSYPDLVASVVTADTYYSLARCGFRSVELRRMLDASYAGDEYSDLFLTSLSCITIDELPVLRPQFEAGIQNADLITVNIGSNDTLTYALTRLGAYMSKISDSSVIGPIAEQLNGLGSLGQLAGNILSTAEALGVAPLVLAELADALLDGQAMFKENWDAIITRIRELNPDATIVAIGMYNPFRELKLTSESLISVGRMADTAVRQMNRYIRFESACSAESLVAEVPDTEVYEFPPLMDDTFWDNFVKNVHPTADGHAYMAEQILKLLPEADPVDPTDPVGPNTPSDLNTEDHMAYITGYSDGTVQPNADITRAEVAAIFYRLLDEDAHAKYDTTANGFSDVPADAWYGKAVSTLSAMGVLKGYEDGTFRPDASITRAELAAVAVRFFRAPVAPAEDRFSDIAGHWANEAINAAAQLGIVSGYEDGTFRPANNITRAETIQMVNNVLGRCPDKDHLLPGMVTFSDNQDTTKWYYAAIQEAANSHDYELVDGTEHWTKLK